MKSDISIELALQNLLRAELETDLGTGDITTRSIENNPVVSGQFIAKDNGVLAGTDAIHIVYQLLNSDVSVSIVKEDRSTVSNGDIIANVHGPASELLSGERVILNLLQHLSGIASATNRAVSALEGSPTRVCDTRKTLPGLRTLQKYAVRCGGGYNHRFRLDDGVMVKDNHIAMAGGISNAVQSIRKQVGHMIKIEVECETELQVREAVSAKADIILLDNKTPEEAKKLREAIPGNIIVELSGGITSDTIGSYKDCGADYISLGSLTHSVSALDISFNIDGSKIR